MDMSVANRCIAGVGLRVSHALRFLLVHRVSLLRTASRLLGIASPTLLLTRDGILGNGASSAVTHRSYEIHAAMRDGYGDSRERDSTEAIKVVTI